MSTAKLIGRKRSAAAIEDNSGCPLNIKFSVQIKRNIEHSSALDVVAIAELTTSGGIQQCKVVKKISDKKIEEPKVALLEATLIKRGRTCYRFHDACDAVSDEVNAAGIALFDYYGRLRGPITETITRKEFNELGVLYITCVDVKEPHRGKDIGIMLCYAVMKALKDKWSLAAMFPAPMHHDKTGGVSFDDVVVKLSRYFSRAGFIQVCGHRPHALNKYWVCEVDAMPDAILPKAHSTAIVVSRPPENPELEGADNDLINAIVKEPSFSSSTSTSSATATKVQKSLERKIVLLRKKLQKIISRGGDVNRSLSLHYAASKDRGHVFKLLVKEFGANINLQDASGCTPLHIAAIDIGKNDIIELLSLGAKKRMKCNDNKTAKQHCEDAKICHEDFIRIFRLSDSYSERMMKAFDECIALLS